jgi:hypothetical protein
MSASRGRDARSLAASFSPANTSDNADTSEVKHWNEADVGRRLTNPPSGRPVVDNCGCKGMAIMPDGPGAAYIEVCYSAPVDAPREQRLREVASRFGGVFYDRDLPDENTKSVVVWFEFTSHASAGLAADAIGLNSPSTLRGRRAGSRPA